METAPRAADTGGVGLSAKAFADIYGQHMPELTRYCRRILRDSHDAEDAAQNAMERALTALGDGCRPVRVRPWLFTIAQREAINVLRRRARAGEAQLGEAADVSLPSPEEVAAVRERLAELLGDLRELAPRQRDVLVARELGGRSYRAIARELGTTEANAHQIVLEARQSLRHFDVGRSLACSQVQTWISAHDHAHIRTRRVRAHMRACAGCRAFEAGIRTRRRDLALLLPGIGGGGLWSTLAGLFGGAGAKAVTAGVAVVAAGALAVSAPHEPASKPSPSRAPAARAAAEPVVAALPVVRRALADRAPGATRVGRRSGRRRAVTRSRDRLATSPRTSPSPGTAHSPAAHEASRHDEPRATPTAAPSPTAEPAPTASPETRPAPLDLLEPVQQVIGDATETGGEVTDTAGEVVDDATDLADEVVGALNLPG